MDLAAITVLLWQVCLAEAIICLIFLLGILLETGGWRMAVRREVTGADKGTGALKKFPSLKRLTSLKIFPSLKRLPSLNIFPTLRRFPLAITKYAARLGKRSQKVLGGLGKVVSPPVPKKEEKPRVAERFYSDISEYAKILKSHASAIESLSQVSHELKEEISKQHKILVDLSKAMEKVTTKSDLGLEVKIKPEIVSEPVRSAKEQLITEQEKRIQIPGHFQYRQPPADEQDIAVSKEERAGKPCLATRHTLAAREFIAKRG